jgi:hypothetical protein
MKAPDLSPSATAVVMWLIENASHDAFHPRHGGSLTHQILCVLASGQASAAQLAASTGASLTSVRGSIRLLVRAGAILGGPQGQWQLAGDTRRLESSLDAMANQLGTAGSANQRLVDRAVQVAQRRAVVASHARRLSDERAAERAIYAIVVRPLPWQLDEEQWRDGVVALPGRIVSAATVALDSSGRAHRAGRWDVDDLVYVAGLVVDGLGWPEVWLPTKAWTVEGVRLITDAADPSSSPPLSGEAAP